MSKARQPDERVTRSPKSGEYRQISPQEISRRREVIARTLKLREKIGPVDISVSKTIRSMREGKEQD